MLLNSPQSPVEEAAVLSPAEESAAAGALDLGMQQQQQQHAHAHHAALPPPPPPPRAPPQMLPGPNPFGFPAFPDGFPRPPFGR